MGFKIGQYLMKLRRTKNVPFLGGHPVQKQKGNCLLVSQRCYAADCKSQLTIVAQ